MIYRKESLVNWSCALNSTISDIEIENIAIDGPTKISVPGYEKPILFGEIFNISYKLSDDNGYINVATTRPETILGDTAVAVHPNDERYTQFRNDNVKLWHPFRSEWIALVADDSVNPAFGTGAVKITPAHSKADYDIAARHNLPIISVIDTNGLIVKRFENYASLPRFIARDRILNDLAQLDLYQSKSNHKFELPMCSRSKDVIELLIKPQWFLKCEKISKRAIEAVDNQQLFIKPNRFENEWRKWLEKSIDWCLSRQIWWGHQIPAYHCTYENQSIWIAAHNHAKALQKAADKFKISTKHKINVHQDKDVLDTWFSSGILPFSLNGFPETENFNKNGYPLSILVSGHDILFFWIARMVILSLYFKNDVPFREVLLHGIICDEQGKKMSKSRGNVISPHQIINGATINVIFF